MKINTEEIQKILIIQYQPFGDVLLNTGYLPALRRKFPTAKIDFLVRKPYHNALLENPDIDELVIFQNGKGTKDYLLERIKLISNIRKRKYDLVIDQIRNTGSAQITILSGAKYRLGLVNQRWRSYYNLKAERKKLRYYSAMKFDTLAPLGIEEEKHKLFFHISQDSTEKIKNWFNENNLSGDKLICFSPGTPVKGKQWDLANYAKLADLIIEKTDCRVLLLWAPNEKEDVETVKSFMENEPIMALPTTFNEAAAVLKECRLLVCNDGGLNHLSVATETPSIAFFGKHKPTRWSPASVFKGYHHFYNESADYNSDKSLGIPVEQVFSKIKEIVG
ncbi:MAG: glycosyltransferase family 9 protein [Calditrichaeota bacterium]|nr:glycosyltransferase family 9 protein [Calditrichota bacterium]